MLRSLELCWISVKFFASNTCRCISYAFKMFRVCAALNFFVKLRKLLKHNLQVLIIIIIINWKQKNY